MIRKPYSRFCAVAASLESAFLLFVRLYWGWQFAQSGWGKIQHLPKVGAFFASLGIPFPYANAVVVSWMELIGGFLLAIGFGTRLVAFLLAGDMLVAYLTDGRDNLLSFLSDPGKFYSDAAFTFLFASIIVLVFGPGKISLDYWLGRRYDAR